MKVKLLSPLLYLGSLATEYTDLCTNRTQGRERAREPVRVALHSRHHQRNNITVVPLTVWPMSPLSSACIIYTLACMTVGIRVSQLLDVLMQTQVLYFAHKIKFIVFLSNENLVSEMTLVFYSHY